MLTFLSQGKFVYYILIIYLVREMLTLMGVQLIEGRLYKSQFAQLGTWVGCLVDSALRTSYKHTTIQHHFKLNEEALLSGEVHFSRIDEYCCTKDKHQSSTVARFWTRITTFHCYFQVLLSWCKLYEPFLEVLPSSTVLPWLSCYALTMYLQSTRNWQQYCASGTAQANGDSERKLG